MNSLIKSLLVIILVAMLFSGCSSSPIVIMDEYKGQSFNDKSLIIVPLFAKCLKKFI